MTAEDAKLIEDFARKTLEEGDQNQIDQALARFEGMLSSWLSFCWTHGLSHLLDFLWEKGQIKWLKRLHGVAVAIGQGQGPNGYHDPNGDWNCFERLPQTLLDRAPYNTDPRQVGLDPEQIDWSALTYTSAGLEATIRAMPFASEEERVLFLLSHPSQYEQATYPEIVPAEEVRLAGMGSSDGGDQFRQMLTYLREQGVSEERIQEALAQRPAWIALEKERCRF